MSDRTSDIRMYVEHLFEGRTLTPETIELKEEIYGNLTARYEDYCAQGMSADEAFERTCKAVTSVDDVLDGEKDAGAAGVGGAAAGNGAADAGAADAGTAGTPGAGETVVAPRPADARADDAPAAPGGQSPAARRGWPGWKIAAVVVVAVVAVWLLGTAAFGMVAGIGRDAFQDTTGASVQPVDVDAGDVTYVDGDAPVEGTGGSGSNSSSGGAASPTTADGVPVISGDAVAREVASHDAAALSGSVATSWPVDAAGVAQIAGGLPLAEYVSSTGSESGTVFGNLVTAEYEWVKDERVARVDGDAVEAALAYDAAALLCAVPNADAVRLTVRETDNEDGELDVDAFTFRRADVEGVLGTSLTAERLTDGSWEGLRAQLSQERTYDRVVDRAEHD